MKLVMTAGVAYMYPCHKFGKPLNPVLGETYQAIMPDGGLIACEQISHHPPIAAINYTGPYGLFEYTG